MGKQPGKISPCDPNFAGSAPEGGPFSRSAKNAEELPHSKIFVGPVPDSVPGNPA